MTCLGGTLQRKRDSVRVRVFEHFRSRSRALLCRVTAPDQRRFVLGFISPFVFEHLYFALVTFGRPECAKRSKIPSLFSVGIHLT